MKNDPQAFHPISEYSLSTHRSRMSWHLELMINRYSLTLDFLSFCYLFTVCWQLSGIADIVAEGEGWATSNLMGCWEKAGWLKAGAIGGKMGVGDYWAAEGGF